MNISLRLPRFKLNQQNFVTIFLFLSLFIEITNVPNNIHVQIYGNIIGFTLLFISLLSNIRNAFLNITLVLFIFIFYYIINPYFYYASIEPYKALFYSIIGILLAIEFNKKNYIEKIESIFFYYILLTIPLFFIGIGVDSNGAAERIQGFMSEPSALSMLLCFLFFQFYEKKKYYKLIIVLIALALTQSLIAYATLLIFYLLKLIADKNKVNIIKLFIATGSTYLLLIWISQLHSNNWLIKKLSSAAIFLLSGGKDGRNTRAYDSSTFFDQQNQNDFSFFLGNGPYFDVYYYQQLEQTTQAFNIQTIIFFNFGLLGVVCGLIILIYTLFKIRKTPYFFLYLSALSYALINSASGIVNYIYLFTLIFYVFLLKSNNRVK